MDRQYTKAVQQDMGFLQGLSLKSITGLNCCPALYYAGPITARMRRIDERRLATRRKLIELCKNRPA